MKNTAKEMYSIVTSWLEEHHRMRLSSNVEGRKDFIHVMLSTLEGVKFSEFDQDTVFKRFPLTLIVAGTESTSVTMAWAVALLLNNPDVLKESPT
ncbi:cytochrome P450 CYP82D47-like protein [Cinnamomum micranthum f. kanehirae]|uniref:Cytochrome P450 CYP82D47-like protein n=1 Tax=Cinnamomum micranthum f. kanehirae TaxID=337451 RepID=A0A3S3NAI9_9MAGN|nr:cytochrome P450 CYP82D47-like protein [Cinnamomum micranthum f. kanehirae]